MSLAVVRSRALDGLNALPVQVEVQLANGLPSFALVGLADTEVKESRERVRAALLASGFEFPHTLRTRVSGRIRCTDLLNCCNDLAWLFAPRWITKLIDSAPTLGEQSGERMRDSVRSGGTDRR